ncbi:hypothetical protein Tco_0206881 [Tanacetum coccineum]
MATADINGPSIRNSEHYGDAIDAPNADTSFNWQSGSGNRQPTASLSARSTHGLPNINTRSRSRRVPAVIHVALSRASTPRTTKNICYICSVNVNRCSDTLALCDMGCLDIAASCSRGCLDLTATRANCLAAERGQKNLFD